MAARKPAPRKSAAPKRITKRQPPLGEGGRFKAIEEAARKSGAANPAAVAAAAGRKAHGQAAMTRWSLQGKRDEAREERARKRRSK